MNLRFFQAAGEGTLSRRRQRARFLLRLATDGPCLRRSRSGEDLLGRCLPPGSLWCRSSFIAHITVRAIEMNGSQAARTRRPAVVRPDCVAVEKALVDALSCGRAISRNQR